MKQQFSEYESPLLFPSLSKLESLPIKKLTFNFSSRVLENRKILENCTVALQRIDDQLRELNSSKILHNIRKATKLTYKNCEIPSPWKKNVEESFHSHILKNGSCPRDLYADCIDIIEKWLLNLAEILETGQKGPRIIKTSLLLKEIEIKGN
ncbi:unnamed protein product [Auanema sp. JU1783]|nr:unnamed protein product [Auanema sp. JU1783]